MRGVIVSNAYLGAAKFREPREMLSAAMRRAGIEPVCLTNAEIAQPIGDERSVRSVTGDADFVIFWDKDVECAMNLELCGYPVLNSSDCIRICDDKALTHIALSKHRVPSIDTITCPLSFDGYNDLSFIDEAAGRIGFPMVVKDRFGSFGEQVRLADSAQSLRSMLSGPYVPRMLQRYIECGGRDIRVEVVGGRAIAAMERSAGPGEFRSNATLGGKVTPYVPTEDEAEIAVSAAEAVGADFAGVDIIRASEGPVVCEVNSNAHMRNLLDSTGIDASDAIIAHAMRAVRR